MEDFERFFYLDNGIEDQDMEDMEYTRRGDRHM